MIRPIHYCFPSRSVPLAAPPYCLPFSSKQRCFPEVQSLSLSTDIIFFPLAPLSLPHCSCSPESFAPQCLLLTLACFTWQVLLWCSSRPTETAMLPLFMPNQGFWNWDAREHRSVYCMPPEMRRLWKLLSQVMKEWQKIERTLSH